MVNIEIDPKSGFCFGVVNAIKKAEEELAKGTPVYCLGDIVHNGQEVKRLTEMGLVTINLEEFKNLRDVKVLFRAHGEPPSTYEIARQNNIELIDASCPVVLKLQKRIKNSYEAATEEQQIVIYGKPGHAEIVGLLGQVDNNAIVIENKDDLSKIDFTRNVRLFSQTTKSLAGFNHLVATISERMAPNAVFEYSDTICRQVANRIPNIAIFAEKNDIILFVSGKKSSNGKVLYEHSKSINPNTYLINDPEEIDGLNLDLTKKIGICGATSTPGWLMEAVAERIRQKATNK
ncbi:MAG TPA: 4-hydroxy-3-methylbut-2-enyl diphosphate reductase [Paludibacteraceae bacterium]|nr:4-hydroxy-3-methylbut-2-enyl diphosphate reductase [Paludibacteraceae bacterium]